MPHNPAVARAWFKRAASSGLAAAGEQLGTRTDPFAARLTQSDTLHPGVPVTPLGGDEVALGPGNAAEFVFTAPAEAIPVRYFLQVVARDAPGSREIHADYVDVTAILVRLAAGHAFAWRVFTVSPRGGSYTVTPWVEFRTRGAAKEGQGSAH